MGPPTVHVYLKPTEAGFIDSQLINYSDRSNLDIIGMDSRLLKTGASAIIPSLRNIFNMSLRRGDLHVPHDWKCAQITPIYKGKESLKNVEITVQWQSFVM